MATVGKWILGKVAALRPRIGRRAWLLLQIVLFENTTGGDAARAVTCEFRQFQSLWHIVKESYNSHL
jgi:hypothetical protein